MAKGTVLVNLKRSWFGPDNSLYEARDNPHEFPAYYADPPKQRKGESDDDFELRQKANPKYELLPSTAEVVESTATVVVEQNTGGGEKVYVPTAVEDGVKSVGNAVGTEGLTKPTQPVAEAAKVAKEAGLDQVGGKPRESGPLPAGTKVTK